MLAQIRFSHSFSSHSYDCLQATTTRSLGISVVNSVQCEQTCAFTSQIYCMRPGSGQISGSFSSINVALLHADTNAQMTRRQQLASAFVQAFVLHSVTCFLIFRLLLTGHPCLVFMGVLISEHGISLYYGVTNMIGCWCISPMVCCSYFEDITFGSPE